MATNAKVAQGTIGSTVDDTVDLEVSGFGTPTAAVVFFGDAAEGVNPKDNACWSVGFWTASAQCCVAFQDVSGDVDGRAGSAVSTAKVAMRIVASSISAAPSISASYTAAAAPGGNGIRVTCSESSLTTQQRRVYAILINGTTSVSVGNVNLGTATSAVDVTGPGFLPDLVFAISHGSNATTDSANIIFSLGVAHRNSGGTVSQGMVAAYSHDAATPSRTGVYVSGSNIAGQVFSDAATWLASIGDFDSSGFSLTPSASASNDAVLYMALKLADADDAYVGVVDVPTGTGNQSYTGTGFTPLALMLLPTAATAVDTVRQAGAFSMGATDGTRTCSIGIAMDDAQTTTDSQTRYDTSNVVNLDLDSGVADAVGAYSSFDSNGWTLNYSDGSGLVRKMLAFAIGDSTASSYAHPTLSLATLVPAGGNTYQPRVTYTF